MDLGLLAILFLLGRGAGGGQRSAPGPQRQPQPQPRRPGNAGEAWARAIGQASNVSPTIAAGLARAAMMQVNGPPTAPAVRAVLDVWERSRVEAEKHKQPGVTWDDRDLLWYATMHNLRPELLAGTGARAAETTVSILKAFPGDLEVHDVLDRATYVATGRRLPPPPPAPRREPAPAPAPAPVTAQGDEGLSEPLRFVPPGAVSG